MTIYRWQHDELEEIVQRVHGWVEHVCYNFNRAYGLMARLHNAMAEGFQVAIDSAMVRPLTNDATELRDLAGKLDRVVATLTSKHREE